MFLIMCILCVIIIIVMLKVWLIFFNNVNIEVVVVGFNVFVVLLYRSIFGLVISVFVIVIFCFCLLDNLLGNWFFLLFNFINLSIFVICCLIFVLFFLFKMSGIVIFLNIVVEFSKLKCWNIILIFFLIFFIILLL